MALLLLLFSFCLLLTDDLHCISQSPRDGQALAMLRINHHDVTSQEDSIKCLLPLFNQTTIC